MNFRKKLIDKPSLSDEEITSELLKMNFGNAKNNYFKVKDENPKNTNAK